MLDILVMIKDGGYRNLKIKPEMLEPLAVSIKKQGFEYVELLSGVIEIVGFVVTGSQTGDRIIMLEEKPQAIVSTEPHKP